MWARHAREHTPRTAHTHTEGNMRKATVWQEKNLDMKPCALAGEGRVHQSLHSTGGRELVKRINICTGGRRARDVVVHRSGSSTAITYLLLRTIGGGGDYVGKARAGAHAADRPNTRGQPQSDGVARDELGGAPCTLAGEDRVNQSLALGREGVKSTEGNSGRGSRGSCLRGLRDFAGCGLCEREGLRSKDGADLVAAPVHSSEPHEEHVDDKSARHRLGCARAHDSERREECVRVLEEEARVRIRAASDRVQSAAAGKLAALECAHGPESHQNHSIDERGRG